MLQELHISHPGIQRMKLLARSHLWWPDIDQDIQELEKGCCASQEVKQTLPVAPLHPKVYSIVTEWYTEVEKHMFSMFLHKQLHFQSRHFIYIWLNSPLQWKMLQAKNTETYLLVVKCI